MSLKMTRAQVQKVDRDLPRDTPVGTWLRQIQHGDGIIADPNGYFGVDGTTTLYVALCVLYNKP